MTHRGLGHIFEKTLPLGETLRNKFRDPRHEIVLSVDRPEIEEDHRLKDLFGRIIEIDNPMAVVIFPGLIGPAPFRIDGHDPALAAGKPALLQSGDNPSCKVKKIALNLLLFFGRDIGKNNGIVLIGPQGLFPPALAAQERSRHRGREADPAPP